MFSINKLHFIILCARVNARLLINPITQLGIANFLIFLIVTVQLLVPFDRTFCFSVGGFVFVFKRSLRGVLELVMKS